MIQNLYQQMLGLGGAILACVIGLEALCRILSLPYHPLQATFQWLVHSGVRLIRWAIHTTIDLGVQIIRAIVTGVVNGVRSGAAARRARP